MKDNLNEHELTKKETVEDSNSAVSEVSATQKKRGRKPNPNKKVYFGDEEERAFVEYVNSTDQSFRNRLFAEKLYYPFTKMIESIIRRYNLFTPDEDFEETFYDTMSFLITKINNFDTSKNKKAYSYCGTICKNYLILKRTQYSKKIQKQVSYDLLCPNADCDNRVDTTQEKQTLEFNTELINSTISQLQESELQIMLSSAVTLICLRKNLMLIFAKKSYFFLNANAIIKKIAVNSKLSDTMSF